MIPALIPSWSACEPSVAETWVSEIRCRSIGSAPICSVVASSCAVSSPCSPLKPPEIWAPWRPSIPSGFSAKLMIGRLWTSLSRMTAKWPESAAASSRADRADRLRLAALGDLPGDVLEVFPALVGEFEGDVRFAGALRVFLLRFGDFAARERVFVVQREPAGLGGFVDFAGRVGRQFGDEDGPGRHFDHEPVFRQRFAGRAFVEVFLGRLRAGEQFVRRLFFEEVVARSSRPSIFRSFRFRFLFCRQQRRRGRRSGRRRRAIRPCVLGAFRVAARCFPFRFELFQPPRRAAPGRGGRRSPARGRSGSAPSRRSRAARSSPPVRRRGWRR